MSMLIPMTTTQTDSGTRKTAQLLPPTPRAQHRKVRFSAAMVADAATIFDAEDEGDIHAAAARLTAAERAETILPPSTRSLVAERDALLDAVYDHRDGTPECEAAQAKLAAWDAAHPAGFAVWDVINGGPVNQ